MVVPIIYVIGAQDMVGELCAELANAILENMALKYTVGILQITGDGPRLVDPVEKLSVQRIADIRNTLLRNFAELGEGGPDLQSKPRDLLASQVVKPMVSQLVGNLPDPHKLAFCLDGSITELTQPDPNVEMGEFFCKGRTEIPPRRQVRPVKTFEGDFTIGDPQTTQLRAKVAMYPFTRRASPPEVAHFIDGKRIVQTSNYVSNTGDLVPPQKTERGYIYLDEVIPVDEGVQALMDGEFENATEWPKAFELLATVPRIPPWVMMDRSDVVVGSDLKARKMVLALSKALEESKMDAIARLVREPRHPAGKKPAKKGKLELVVLQPHDALLMCTPLPFREDFKHYYRFAEVPTKPDPELAELDDEMDALVDSMTATNDSVVLPVANPLIERISKFVRDKAADGTATIPPVPEWDKQLKGEISEESKQRSSQLMKKFGIVKRSNTNGGGAVPARRDESKWDFDFI